MAAGLLSCAKEMTAPQEETASAGVPVKFEISVAGTKADGGIAKQDWAEGDAISVFIMGIPGKYLVLSYDGSSWTTTPVGGDITDIEIGGLDDNYFLTAVHFPVAAGIAYEDNGEYAKNRFTFKSGGQPVYGSYYLYDEKEPFTVTDGTTVNATLAMQIPAGMVQLYFPGGEGKENLNGYTFASPMIRPVACAAVGLDGTIQESVLQRGARIGGGMPYGQGIIFAGRYDNPGEAAGHTFSLTNNDELWTIDINREDPFEGGMLYTFPNFPGGWNIELAGELYVDLGLTSGVKWASCNLGAANPEDYGDYFAWGELQPKEDYSGSTYLHYSGGYIIKYCSNAEYGKDGYTDTFTRLQPEDDAAYAALGGKFRMPTSADWSELRTECKWEWKTKVNGYASNGYLVTSKQPGNTNSIFLPAAGRREDTNPPSVDDTGTYWISSYAPAMNYFDGDSMYFQSDYISFEGDSRAQGLSVRPVFSD